MIHGVGTDIVAILRLGELLARHKDRTLEKCLAPQERDDCLASKDPARFLAKRFAAKEALGKALMRQLIAHHLSGQSLQSRRVFIELQEL